MKTLQDMEKEENNVCFVGARSHRLLTHFVQKKIREWIRMKRLLLFLPDSSEYSAVIKRFSSDPKDLECRLHIRIGNHVWTSLTRAAGLKMLLSDCFSELSPCKTA